MNEKTISIFPNTMGFGFVVLSEKGEILDYGITSFRPVKNEKCIKKIGEIISYYQPLTLILENYLYSHKSERVKNLIDMICENWKDSITIYKYSRKQIRETFELFGARNKFEISRRISEVYTQLQSKLPEKRRTWEPENYYQGLFDAMSLFLTHQYLNE